MTDRKNVFIAAAVAALLLTIISVFVVGQKGWFSGVGWGGEDAARAASVEVTLSGSIAYINTSELAITDSGENKPGAGSDKGKTVKIGVSRTTRYEETAFDESGIPKRLAATRKTVKKGDIVTVEALLGKKGELTAVLVIVSPRPGEEGGIPTNGYTGGTVINGIVESAGEGAVSVKKENGESILVLLGKDVNIMFASQGKQPEQGSAGEITVGEKISVMGVRQSTGEVAARQIMCVK
jgi:hypothetical protein